MFLLVRGPPIALLLALPVLLFLRAERTNLARSERAAEELLVDVRALAPRGDLARLRTVLESQGTPFARGLLAVLSVGPGGARDRAAAWRAREESVTSAGRFLVGVLALLLLSLSCLSAVLTAGILSDWTPGLTDALVIFLLFLLPGASSWFAFRSALRLDRARRERARRRERWLLEVASLVSTPPAVAP